MRKIHFITTSLLFTIFLSVFAGAISFDDSGSSIILSNNDYYELAFGKGTGLKAGSILYVTDKVKGDNITNGEEINLWRAQFDGVVADTYSSLYSDFFPDDFSYSWSEPVLTLNYVSRAGTQKLNVTVNITASDEAYFDISFSVHNLKGYNLTNFEIPSSLPVDTSSLNELLYPSNPGLIINGSAFPGFIEFRHPGAVDSPSPGYPATFSDIFAINFTRGSIATYTLWSESDFQPTAMSLDAGNGLTLSYTFSYTVPTLNRYAWIQNGSTWSPPARRFWIGRGFRDVVLANRNDTPLAGFDSVQDKFGSDFENVSKSILLHLDPTLMYGDFDLIADALPDRPAPAILMLSNYWNASDSSDHFHSAHHNDYLPPDPDFGTTQDLKDLITAAHSEGQYVMPFTLPYWWSNQSPSMLALGAVEAENISIWDTTAGFPGTFCWDAGNNNTCGYEVSPYHSTVRNLYDDLVNDITTEYAADFMYQDVIAASPCWLEFNPASPDPMNTTCEGWRDLLRNYSTPRVDEYGYDMFAETEAGFLGSTYTDDEISNYDTQFGAGEWRFFPMASLLAHDKVIFYQYWEKSSATKDALSFNLAMGFNLNFWLIESGLCGLNCPAPLGDSWEYAVADFQKYVVSRYVGSPMTDYIEYGDNTSLSVFDNISVFMNWDENNNITRGNHTLPPYSAMVTSDSGDLTAGVFYKYNNASMSSGYHLIIEQRGDDNITVRHRIGNDTNITVVALGGWSDVNVTAYNGSGSRISSFNATVVSGKITFGYFDQIGGTNTSYYVLTESGSGATCGDSTCDSGENCRNCRTDCGACSSGHHDECDEDDDCDDGEVCCGGDCEECCHDDDCDDGNGCTDDECMGNYCEYRNNTDPCDDGDDCTGDDTCLNGDCRGTLIESLACLGVECLADNDCNDGRSCTLDSCDGHSCEYDDSACQDGSNASSNKPENDSSSVGGQSPQTGDSDQDSDTETGTEPTLSGSSSDNTLAGKSSEESDGSTWIYLFAFGVVIIIAAIYAIKGGFSLNP